MTKFLCILIAVAFSLEGFSQDIYMTRSGRITFFSKAPIENIEAVNKSVTCIFKKPTGELAFKLFMKSFEFERAAMQDHFNKDYVHSDKFPQSSFEGKILGYEAGKLSENGEYAVQVEGNLSIHGVTKPIRESGTIIVKEGAIDLSSTFFINLKDFDVKIPSNFINNISEEIQITVEADLEPYQR